MLADAQIVLADAGMMLVDCRKYSFIAGNVGRWPKMLADIRSCVLTDDRNCWSRIKIRWPEKWLEWRKSGEEESGPISIVLYCKLEPWEVLSRDNLITLCRNPPPFRGVETTADNGAGPWIFSHGSRETESRVNITVQAARATTESKLTLVGQRTSKIASVFTDSVGNCIELSGTALEIALDCAEQRWKLYWTAWTSWRLYWGVVLYTKILQVINLHCFIDKTNCELLL